MQTSSPGPRLAERGNYQPPPQLSSSWYIASELDNLGYAHTKKTLKDPERREELFYRARRGLISYEKRPIAELRKFCSQRNLNSVPAKGSSKQALISLLWEADDHASFSQFTELPAELRIRVYEYVLQDPHLRISYKPLPSHKNYAIHRQPAITRTNRLLRKEALPIFYDNASAHLWAHSSLSMSLCSVLLGAPDGVISQWRKVTIAAISLGRSDQLMCGDWKIVLPGKGHEAQISYSNTTLRLKGLPDDKLMKEVEAAIREVLRKMEVREGMAKLSRADIEELGYVVKKARASLQNREDSV